ncbi:MAG: diguanylate cyclase, partial [Elusimicrobia bacterium]|nr:diguanylate cyclase [Elusimicrobiota bacterium]
DGSGYPNNLIGEEIPLLSRILTLADTYAALRGNRPYRRSLTSKEAIEEIKKESGKQFDPEIVKVFIAALKKRSSPE